MLPRDLCKTDPLQFQHGIVRVKSWQPMSNSWSTFVGSAKTDPVRFKWGFGEGLLEGKFAFFEASKNPIPKRRNPLAKPIFVSKKGPI